MRSEEAGAGEERERGEGVVGGWEHLVRLGWQGWLGCAEDGRVGDAAPTGDGWGWRDGGAQGGWENGIVGECWDCAWCWVPAGDAGMAEEEEDGWVTDPLLREKGPGVGLGLPGGSSEGQAREVGRWRGRLRSGGRRYWLSAVQ